MGKNDTKAVTQEAKSVEAKSCYKFIENVSIWGVVYAKDSCIELGKDDLAMFAEYVKLCTWSHEHSDDWKCKTC